MVSGRSDEERSSRAEASTATKTGWIGPGSARRDWSSPQWGTSYPENWPEFRETNAGASRVSQTPPGWLPFYSLPAPYFVYTAHTAPHTPSVDRPIARSFARADYNDRLQRCRRSSWTAAAARTRTRPGTKRQRPTGGTRTQAPRGDHSTASLNSVDRHSAIVVVQVSSRLRVTVMWSVSDTTIPGYQLCPSRI